MNTPELRIQMPPKERHIGDLCIGGLLLLSCIGCLFSACQNRVNCIPKEQLSKEHRNMKTLQQRMTIMNEQDKNYWQKAYNKLKEQHHKHAINCPQCRLER